MPNEVASDNIYCILLLLLSYFDVNAFQIKRTVDSYMCIFYLEQLALLSTTFFFLEEKRLVFARHPVILISVFRPKYE